MAYQPMGRPPHASDPQKTATIISGVIGAIALVVVLIVLVTSGTKQVQHSDAFPGGQQGVGNSGATGAGGAGGAAGGSSGGGPATRPAVSKSYLQTHFPLPPGTTAYPRPSEVPSGAAWWVNSASSLDSVKAFYDRDPFQALGLKLTLNDTITGRGGVIGYAGYVENGTDTLLAHLQIRHDIDNLPAATVLIQADYN